MMPIISLSSLKITDQPQEIEEIFEEAVGKNLEGVMAKKLDGTYRAGARDFNWIKYKKSYSAKLNDTIDALVMGYDFGQGKRTAFGIGGFLIGVYDQKSDSFKTVAKIGTGLTDEEWRTLKVESRKYQVLSKPNNYDVDKAMVCDVWVEPKIVVEIRADEITQSPVHTAGLALRFPRLEKFRDDKMPEDVTNLKEIEEMFRMQGIKKSN